MSSMRPYEQGTGVESGIGENGVAPDVGAADRSVGQEEGVDPGGAGGAAGGLAGTAQEVGKGPAHTVAGGRREAERNAGDDPRGTDPGRCRGGPEDPGAAAE